MDLRQLIDDTRYWVEHGTYPPDEIAVRFSHRLVAIHPFPNGNGRFSRMVGDMLAVQLGCTRFTWGSVRSEEHTSELQSLMRNSYAVFCLTIKTHKHTTNTRHHPPTSHINKHTHHYNQ